MQAVLLAAGAARRMQPLSDTVHKAMLPIGGTTILARLVDGLRSVGVGRITVVLGHRADEVREYLLATCPGPDYRFVVNDRYASTNNIVSLGLALDSLEADDDTDVILAECDLLLGPSVLPRLAGAERGNVALVDHYRPGMDGTVVSVKDGEVVQLFTPERQQEGFDFRGTFKTLNLYRFTGAFCRETLRPLLAVRDDTLHDGAYYEAVLARLGDLREHHLSAEVVTGEEWAEVDDPVDLAAARFVFEPERREEIVDRSRGGHWDLELTDHAFMRNVHFPPVALVAALRHALPRLLDGYGSTQDVLEEKLAWFLRCDQARLVAFNGATQAYPILRRAWAGLRVAVPSPTFGEYDRCFPQAVTYRDGPGVDLAELDRLAGEVDVLVVVSPNNPTGTTLDTAELLALAHRHPATRLLVDESFVDFSDQEPLRKRLDRDAAPNVTVLCSLSKTLGMPGLRIGFAYGTDPAWLSELRAELPIWNMNAVAEHAIELLLKFRPQLEASLAQTDRDRARLTEWLLKLPAVRDVAPSGGNFLLATLHGDGDAARTTRSRLLREHALDVKDVTGRFPDGRPRLRLGVRDDADNHALVRALAEDGPP